MTVVMHTFYHDWCKIFSLHV